MPSRHKVGHFRVSDAAYALFGSVLNALDEMMRVVPPDVFFEADQKFGLLKAAAPH